MIAQGKLDGFLAFVRTDRLGLEFATFGQDGGHSGVALGGIRRGAHAEDAGAAGGVVAGADGMNEPVILLDFPVESRAAALAGDDGQHIERGDVRIGRCRDVPGEV